MGPVTAVEFHECIARAQARLRVLATIEPDDPYDVVGAAALGLAMLATPALRENEATSNMPGTNVYLLGLLGIHVPLADIEQFAADLCGPAH